MLTVTKLERRPRGFARLVGLSPEQFRGVLETFTPLWLEAERARLSRPHRRRAIGAGNRHKLALPERLLVTLLYLRHYATQHLLGVLFDPFRRQRLPQHQRHPAHPRAGPPGSDPGPHPPGQPGRAARQGERAQEAQADRHPRGVPRGVPRARGPDRRLQRARTGPALRPPPAGVNPAKLRGAEPAKKKPNGKRPAGRPVDKKRFYSKKAGAHTLKTQLAVTPEGLIAHQSATVPGKMHDAMLLRRSRLGRGLPQGVRLIGDKGYTGMGKVYPEREVVTPTKRPKGKDHTDDERDFNKQVAKVRIVVENAFLAG